MKRKQPLRREATSTRDLASGADLLNSLIHAGQVRTEAPNPVTGLVLGELVGIGGAGQTPLVIYPGQRGSAALAARSLVELRAEHIGGKVALMFEGGDGSRPVIMGLIRDRPVSTLAVAPGHVDIEADGERLTVTAKEQVVLRCGKASITLTQTGKILIKGTNVLSRSFGANRIKGGSVQIN